MEDEFESISNLLIWGNICNAVSEQIDHQLGFDAWEHIADMVSEVIYDSVDSNIEIIDEIINEKIWYGTV